jgi:hypothetical protein
VEWIAAMRTIDQDPNGAGPELFQEGGFLFGRTAPPEVFTGKKIKSLFGDITLERTYNLIFLRQRFKTGTDE